jgi:hypothetical protein
MKQVFQLNIQIGDINTDLYFEDKKSAESIVNLLANALNDEAKKHFKVEAFIHEVYSKETASEQILMGLGLTIKDVKS